MNCRLRRALPGLAGTLVLLSGGGVVYLFGGRPMLFGAMVLWGIAFVALVLSIAAALPAPQRQLLIRVLIGLILAVCLLFAGLEGLVAANGRSQIQDEPETMIILGANLWDHEPSPVLEARLDTALEYWKEHPNMTVVVTGGMGDDEPVSEASCMAFYLEAQGVPPEQIILEEQAANTMQNLQFSKEILEERGLSTDNLLVVSSTPHLARAKLLARRNGLDISTLAAPVPGGIGYKTYFQLREGAAIVKSFLFDRG